MALLVSAVPQPHDGELTILSIDGGGIRGLIPAKIIEYLESELQAIEGSPDVRLADYFDYVVGTSTGALVTTMLTAPNHEKRPRPLFTAKEITQLYMDEGPKIFRNDHETTWADIAFDVVFDYIWHHFRDNKALQNQLKPHLDMLRQPILDAINNSEPVAAAADLHLVAAPKNGSLDSGTPTPADYVLKHADGILEALPQALADLDLGLNVEFNVKELKEGLLKTLLNPDFIRCAFLRPKYDGKGLRHVIETKLETTWLTGPTLKDTLTNVVIPTFDVKRNQPVIFSTSQARKDGRMNPKLSDLCIGATAAPTYFPAHNIFTFNLWPPGIEEYNLIDGGVLANNPTMVAMNEILRIKVRHQEESTMDCRKLRILSIGTGEVNHKYTADQCNCWGLVQWMYNCGSKSTPLIDILMSSTCSLVDYNVALLFKSQGCEDNYLRIQDDNLDPAFGAMDDTGKMDKLIGIGEKLLDNKVCRTNWETRRYEPVPGKGTNKEALTDLAKKLVAERKRRTTLLATTRSREVDVNVIDEPRWKKLKA